MAEIVTCPACDKKLQVPEDFFGKTVQCPECKQQFLAQATGAPATATQSAPAGSVPAWEKPPGRDLARVPDDEPRRRSSRDYDEDEEDRPRRRRTRDDEDDHDRRRRRRLTPHRGGMILAFGILSLFVLPIVFGPMAWFMGNADLQAMRSGYMDPSGESQTNTGRILGMLATIMQIVGLVIGCLIAVVFLALAFTGAMMPRH